MLVTDSIHDLLPVFKQGGVFAYPTETVYGLGCDPDNEASVRRLLNVKGRTIDKGLILVAANLSQVRHYLTPHKLIDSKLSIPSKITYTFPAHHSTPPWLTGNFDTLAVRISAHPLIQELCNLLGSALVSTSANLSGQQPAVTSKEVLRMFQGTANPHQSTSSSIDAVLTGTTNFLKKPSTIQDGITGKILRI